MAKKIEFPLESRDFFAAERLARKIGVFPNVVQQILTEGTDAFYVHRWVPKGSGTGKRLISAPQEPLRSVQLALKKRILEEIAVSRIAFGSAKGTNLEENAYPHRNSHSLLCLDFRNAFQSTCFRDHFVSYTGRYYVEKLSEREFGLDGPMLDVMGNLLDCVKGRERFIPQGAPTSNIVFDLCCREMDDKLEGFARRCGGVVTRWVDNLFFSHPDEVIDPSIRRFVLDVIQKLSPFRINAGKTEYIRKGNRPGVPLRFPGIHIVEGELKVPAKKARALRIRLFCAGKAGDSEVLYGVKGYAEQVEHMMPPQLSGVYGKARRSVEKNSEMPG